jgi:hypothetical protein
MVEEKRRIGIMGNKSKKLIHIDEYVSTSGINHYLKEKCNKQKIVLPGHSWGSVLESKFIKQ